MAQPKGAAPISRDVVEIVKKKMAPPPGPPPKGMTNFQPKTLQTRARSIHEDDNYESFYQPRNSRFDNEEDDEEDFDEEDISEDDYVDDDADNYDHEDDPETQYQKQKVRSKYDLYDDEDPEKSRILREKHFNDSPENSPDYGKVKNFNNKLRSNDRHAEEIEHEERHYTRRQPPADPRAAEKHMPQPRGEPMPAMAKLTVNTDRESPPPTPRSENNSRNATPTRNTRRGSGSKVMSPTSVGADGVRTFNFQSVLRSTYRELKHFVMSPSPVGIVTRCYIERSRTGVKMFAPMYSVCADLEDGTGRELMVCRKIMKSRTPHYIFSLKAEDLWRKREQRSRLYLGKLRATSSNTYVLYDNGICDAPDDTWKLLDEWEKEQNDPHYAESKNSPRGVRATAADAKNNGKKDEISLYRKELAVIHYNCKNRPAPAGVRATEICIPHTFTHENAFQLHTSGNTVSGSDPIPSTPGGTLIEDQEPPQKQVYNIEKPFSMIREKGLQNEMFKKNMYVLHERTSRYDPVSACLVDFKGRANIASVKNAQFVESDAAKKSSHDSKNDDNKDGKSIHTKAELEELMKRDSEKEFLMQLGKTTEDCFNMDYRYPLSLFQAFAICIARFDANLSW